MLLVAGGVALAEPTLDAVRAIVDRAPAGHPRLFADEARFATLAAADAPEPVRLRREQLLREAEAVVALKTLRYEKTGRRLLAVSRQALYRVSTLAMAWRLTGRPVFLQAAERELRAVCAFPDWNPSHFLDTAEMTLAVAIGYDWLWADLKPETRATVRQAIETLGIAPSFVGKHGWISNTNNWNQVCHGGLTAGALVLREENPALAARVVQRAVANLPIAMRASFSPDGAYPEGPDYWSYGTTYNVLLLDALESVLGTTFALEEVPGFDRTGDYVAQVTGPTGLSFNYADAAAGRMHPEPALYWLARRFDRPDWAALTDRAFAAQGPGQGDSRRVGALPLLWGPDAPAGGRGANVYPSIDYVAGGEKPIAVLRSAWGDPQALYVGVSGGRARSNHGQMDAGSFVFDALGVRWAIDLGRQNYNSLEKRGVELWNGRQDGDRWRVFRLGHLAHSIPTFGDAAPDVDGFAAVTGFDFGGESPDCVVDLSPVYAGQVARAERRFTLEQRAGLVIEDRVQANDRATTLHWRMTTRADIDIEVDAGGRAVLTQEGKRLIATVSHPVGAAWRVIDISKPLRDHDEANPGARQLALDLALPAGAALELVVRLQPDPSVLP